MPRFTSWRGAGATLLLISWSACNSGPFDVDGHQYECTTDADCGEGVRCVNSVCGGDEGFDAGARDAGSVVGEPLDAGPLDAGTLDAGPFDAGPFDAGTLDAGTLDAGALDAGPLDAGPLDGGPLDAGPFDAGPIDAGTLDAGTLDAGALDAGPLDAGPLDAGPPDAGRTGICTADRWCWVNPFPLGGVKSVSLGSPTEIEFSASGSVYRVSSGVLLPTDAGGDLVISRGQDFWYRTPLPALRRVAAGTNTALPSPSFGLAGASLFPSADGGMWLASASGLASFQGGAWVEYSRPPTCGAQFGFAPYGTTDAVMLCQNEVWRVGSVRQKIATLPFADGGWNISGTTEASLTAWSYDSNGQTQAAWFLAVDGGLTPAQRQIANVSVIASRDGQLLQFDGGALWRRTGPSTWEQLLSETLPLTYAEVTGDAIAYGNDGELVWQPAAAPLQRVVHNQVPSVAVASNCSVLPGFATVGLACFDGSTFTIDQDSQVTAAGTILPVIVPSRGPQNWWVISLSNERKISTISADFTTLTHQFTLPTNAYYNDMVYLDGGTVIAAGADYITGTTAMAAMRTPGGTWRVLDAGLLSPVTRLAQVSTGALALSGHALQHIDFGGVVTNRVAPPSPSGEFFSFICALSDTEVYMGTIAGVQRWNGSFWSLEAPGPVHWLSCASNRVISLSAYTIVKRRNMQTGVWTNEPLNPGTRRFFFVYAGDDGVDWAWGEGAMIMRHRP